MSINQLYTALSLRKQNTPFLWLCVTAGISKISTTTGSFWAIWKCCVETVAAVGQGYKVKDWTGHGYAMHRLYWIQPKYPANRFPYQASGH